MGLLDFECPLCDGVFRADQKDVEVVCPHCQETIGLAADIEVSNPTSDSEQSSVVLTAVPVQQAPRLFPPGYKPTKTQSETDAVPPVENVFSRTVDPLKPEEVEPEEVEPEEVEPEEVEPEEVEPEEVEPEEVE
ncbi:MAG: hypothetical protein VX738_14315, partial [Planctomycetota bacterium]|nr:hypothetical protein [Planctomycetota bacterium]